jgi:hypothetical protein
MTFCTFVGLYPTFYKYSKTLFFSGLLRQGLYSEQAAFLRNISLLGILFYILAIVSLYLIYKRKLFLYQWLTNSLFLIFGTLYLCMFFFSGFFFYSGFQWFAPQYCAFAGTKDGARSGINYKLLCTLIFNDEQLGQNHVYTENEKKNGLPVKYKILK